MSYEIYHLLHIDWWAESFYRYDLGPKYIGLHRELVPSCLVGFVVYIVQTPKNYIIINFKNFIIFNWKALAPLPHRRALVILWHQYAGPLVHGSEPGAGPIPPCFAQYWTAYFKYQNYETMEIYSNRKLIR